MRILFSLFLSFTIAIGAFAQDVHRAEVEAFRKDLNKQYRSGKKSPLKKAARKKFKKSDGHNFFPIDANYRVEATFERVKDTKLVEMETSSDRIAKYDKYGIAIFELNGETFQLAIYQSHRTRTMEAYKNHLFLPFTDLTTGEESYGAGRYIDLEIPDGDTIIIDFNQSYHPYCAYTTGYSCPVTPRENFLDTKIAAGIRNLEVDLY